MALARKLLSVVICLPIGVAALAVTAFLRGGFTLDLREDATPLPRVLQGFAPAAREPDGRRFSGIENGARLRLRRLARAGSWTVRLRARAPGRAVPPELTLFVDDIPAVHRIIPADWTDISFTIPARAADGVIVTMSVDAASAAVDARTSGVQVTDIAFRANSWWRPNDDVLVAVAISSLSLGVLAASALWAPPAIAAIVVAAMAQVFLLTQGLAGEDTYATWTWHWAIVAALIGTVASLLAGRRSMANARAWGSAMAIATCAFIVQGWLLRHPSAGQWDSVFHLHRFQLVQSGIYFFTSEGPGGAFPYPIALYVIAGRIARQVSDPIWLLRGLCVGAHAAAALAVFAAVKGTLGSRRALWAEVLFLAVPAGFHTQAVAYLTNSFGQSLSVIALSLAAAWPFDRRRWLGASLLAITASVAALSHFSSFVILMTTLGPYVVIRGWRGLRAVSVVPVAAATVLAFGLAVGLYYVHFPETYRALIDSAHATPAPASAPPVMRIEAHQTAYVPGLAALRVRLAAVPRYVLRYYDWWLLPLAAAGLVARWRVRDTAMLRLVDAWTLTGVLFFVLGQVTPFDVRYYLGAYPAFVMLSAVAMPEGPGDTPPWRRVCEAVGGYAVLSALWYWRSWLIPP